MIVNVIHFIAKGKAFRINHYSLESRRYKFCTDFTQREMLKWSSAKKVNS